jgi:hypothetical protein
MTCLGISIAAVYFGITIVYCFMPGGHPVPLLVFILGSLLAYLVPTPPPYEQRLFASHRMEYEQLVTLAREQQLAHNSSCSIDRTYETPPGYTEFSHDCIKVDYQPFFWVQFEPRIYLESIVFLDDPARIKDVMGCYSKDGSDRYKQLDENWFLCSMSQ